MANRFQKFIYCITAEAPIFFVFAILWFTEKSKPNEPILTNLIIPSILFIIGVVLIVFFNIFFKMARTKLSIMEVSGSDFKSIDGWNAAYVVTYMFPLASLTFGDVVWPALGIIMILLMVVLVFSDYVTPHPLLVLRYHFYELKIEGSASNYILISRKPIRNIKDIKKVSRVFEFLLIREE